MSVTWNPSDKNANISLSNGDLTYTAANTSWKSLRATEYKSSGKWYWEVTIDAQADVYHQFGVGTSNVSLNSYIGAHAEGYSYDVSGYKWHNGSNTGYGATLTVGDVIGTALDLDNGKIWWSKNGVWQASGDPAAGTNEAYSGLSGSFYPMGSPYTNTNAATADFGDSGFVYSAPAGFLGIGYNGYFSGYVYEQGSPVQRTLLLHRRDNGALADTTTSSGNGYYYLGTSYSGSHYIVCLDNEAGASYNDLIIGDIYPTTISG